MIMKRELFYFSTLLALLISFAGCDPKEDPVTVLSVKVNLPTEIADAVTADGLTVELINTINGNTSTFRTNSEGIGMDTIEEGVYNVNISGEKTYDAAIGDTTFSQTINLAGTSENNTVVGSEYTIETDLYISIASSGWVFKELYFSGSKTPAGSNYLKDQYFEIYNNTGNVLYADGISLGEADHVTSNEINPWQSIINEAYVTQVIFTIPGTGTEYPVQPGTSIILANIGMDHTTVNVNSFNLSNADFEWYDNNALDVDVPEVTNLIKNYSSSLTIWVPFSAGTKSYVIFRHEGTIADFMAANLVTRLSGSGKELTRYKVPNSIILDAVEVGTPSSFASKSMSAALDASFINCGDGDDTRFGKCVRRKIKSTTEGGRVIYLDTNNSATDFLSTVDPKPGIIE